MAEETVPMTYRDEALRADIAQTRRRISGTLTVIQHRLSPQYLKQQAVHAMKEKTREAGNRIVDSVRENPWPAIVTGIGISWLVSAVARARSQRQYQPYQPYEEFGERRPEAGEGLRERGREAVEQLRERGRETAEQWTERAKQIGEKAQEMGSRVTEQVSEKASQFAETARTQTKRAAQSARSTFQSHPLATGLATLAAGLTLGLLIPPSRKEKQWMGSASQDLVDTARELAQEAAERGKVVAERAYESAREEAKEQSSEMFSQTGGQSSQQEQPQSPSPSQSEQA
jgi:ElaB/YqjD/DUF883 family membrane-anchored ribosome-binding protein